jgi:peptidoglycan-associated lipoprotein
MLITNTHKLLFKRLNSLVILFLCFTSLQFVAQKNFIKEADIKYENEAYFSAIDLYKKGEVRIKDVQEKARINFQIAECYRESIEPEQAQTYYDRAIMLRYQKDNPSIYLSLANVLKEQGDYEQAVESINKYLEVVPDNKEAKDFLNSCEMAVTWKSNPTKHIMQNEVSLNSSHYDYSPTWADNTYNKIIFVSARDGSTGDEVDSRTGESFMDLYITERDNNGKWFEAVPLPKGINTKDNEGSAVLTPDGKQIFFTRCPRPKNKKKKESSNLGCEIFHSVFVGDEDFDINDTTKKNKNTWSDAEKVLLKPEGADSLSCGHPAIDSAMTYMIFSADFPGGYGGKDLWISEYDSRETSWMTPTNLGSNINTIGNEMFPYLASDGSLYFSSDGYTGLGGLDIFKSLELSEKQWGDVENLEFPLNSPEHDFGIILEKEHRGMLSSSRHDNPVGGKGKDDIYNFNIPAVVIALEVYVLNKETNEPIPGVTLKLTAIDSTVAGGIVHEYVQTTDVEGKFIFEEDFNGKRYVEHNLVYMLEAEKDSLDKAEKQFTTFNIEKSKRFMEEVYLQPFFQVDESGEIKAADVELEVRYALNKSELLVDTLETTMEQVNSKDTLDLLYNTLIDFPTMMVELSAHTDCQGSDKYNRKLSDKRAQSCVDYLVTKGIDKERMIARGYGEDVPKSEGLACDVISKLPTKEERDAAHQKNRRTQFKVLNYDYVPVDEDQPTEE